MNFNGNFVFSSRTLLSLPSKKQAHSFDIKQIFTPLCEPRLTQSKQPANLTHTKPTLTRRVPKQPKNMKCRRISGEQHVQTKTELLSLEGPLPTFSRFETRASRCQQCPNTIDSITTNIYSTAGGALAPKKKVTQYHCCEHQLLPTTSRKCTSSKLQFVNCAIHPNPSCLYYHVTVCVTKRYPCLLRDSKCTRIPSCVTGM